jgi:rhamnosyltransferase
MNNSICAVVVSFNEPLRLKECIRSLSGQTDKIIIVDNGSVRGLDDVSASLGFSGELHVIRNGRNVGLAAALNQGIRYSLDNAFKWTLLLDQDSSLTENMVPELLKSYAMLDPSERESTAAIVPVVIDRNFGEILPSVIMGGFINKKVRKPPRDVFVHFHITSGSLIRNEVFARTGLMNELLFIDYIDFDFCFRMLEANYRILLSTNAQLSHSLGERKGGMMLGLRQHASQRVYYQTRNRLFTIFKYGRKYRSFLFAESLRCVGKFFKIILLESHKKEKIRMYGKGIRDFIRDYEKLSACSR